MKKPSRTESLNALLQELDAKRLLRSPSELVETVEVPADIAAALATGRPELMRIARPRALTEEECAKVYKLVAVLIETNRALVEHAEHVSQVAASLYPLFKGLMTGLTGLEHFAAFRRIGEYDEDERA